MSEWIHIILDLVLIGVVTGGLLQAMRLIRHLRDLRQGRMEMERFVHEFNATVLRAEAGIKGLRMAARESGDDLETLVEKATQIRDELQFIVESADHLATRLTSAASSVMRPEIKTETSATPEASAPTPAPAAKPAVARAPATATEIPAAKGAAPASRAEKELMQALKKLN